MPHIQLIGPDNHDIDLFAIVLDEQDQPLFDTKNKSLCFYGHIRAAEASRRIGEHAPREIAKLTEKHEDFRLIGNEHDRNILTQISWDHRYHLAFGISCYHDNPAKRKRVFENWQGHVRIVSDCKELSSFTIDNLGDLSKTGCIQICLVEPTKHKFTGFFGSKYTLPIDAKVVKYRNAAQWLAEYGIA